MSARVVRPKLSVGARSFKKVVLLVTTWLAIATFISG